MDRTIKDQTAIVGIGWTTFSRGSGTSTKNLAAQAQSYLNFLLNRPLDNALENAEVAATVNATTRALTELRQAAIDNRPELAELAHLARASEARHFTDTFASRACAARSSDNVRDGRAGPQPKHQ